MSREYLASLRASILNRIEALNLSLSSKVILTEGATGYYAVTPVIAAKAGASNVLAVLKDTDYGSSADAKSYVLELAEYLGVAHKITFIKDLDCNDIAEVDLVTNSGNVRPISRALVERLKVGAVVSLMYESWELRNDDIDLLACRQRGIQVAGVNERHVSVNIFPYLGELLIKLVHQNGLSISNSNVVLICDNSFRRYLSGPLNLFCSKVKILPSLPRDLHLKDVDFIIFALSPNQNIDLTQEDVLLLRRESPRLVLVNFWGCSLPLDVIQNDTSVLPRRQIKKGHMGILLSDLGAEPIIRLQAAGLKVGEVLLKGDNSSEDDLRFIQPI